MMNRSKLIHLAVLFFICIAPQKVAGGEMQTFKGCSLVVTDWADGDSFLVKFPDGVERTLRLYGADCIEWHVTDTSDARRLRSQRRYFGISNYGGGSQTSISAAKGFGEKAALAVRQAVDGQKFSVTTAFADARGDGRYKRIYGFVTLADGRDLAEMLVGSGLARAFGVYREIPGVQTSDEYRERLNDLELRAAKMASGVWKLTDWSSLPEERKEEREESAELDAATDSNLQLSPKSINPNTAARDQLMQLPGIGEKTANLIIEGRAAGIYKHPEDLARIPGIGPKTIKKIRDYLDLTS